MMNTRFVDGKLGRWFRCRNGHPYCVDACGRPTQINRCACGVKIGGIAHEQIRHVPAATLTRACSRAHTTERTHPRTHACMHAHTNSMGRRVCARCVCFSNVLRVLLLLQ
jgi:hypothetical protein